MRRVLLVMYMTLDGVAEFPQYGEVSEADSGAQEDPMWGPRMGSIDTLLLGRGAYQKWASFWPAQKSDPSSSPWAKQFSEFADRAEKVVFSKTLERTDWPNSRIVPGDVGEEVARLRSLPGQDMAIGGGPRLAQSFIERELVDELFIEMFPSLLGSGKPLFHVVSNPEHAEDFIPQGAPGRRDFRLIEAKPLKDGSVLLHYGRIT
jgi:dihydrofolate reductase